MSNLIAQPPDHAAHLQNEVQFTAKLNAHKALTLLITGALFGQFGFLFAAIAGFWEPRSYSSILNTAFPSGEPHFPLTVSEMVHDPASPQGKAFLGFELVGAIMLLTSWYPYFLSNVYTGDRHGLFDGTKMNHCCGCISWTTFRQFLPGLGLALLSLVTTTPTFDKKTSNVSFITCQIHILAATALFGGYILCEMQCLYQAYGKGVVKIGKLEWHVRNVVIIICAIGAVVTIVLQFTLPYQTADEPICCPDKYNRMDKDNANTLIGEIAASTDLEDKARVQQILRYFNTGIMYEVDTAKGFYRILKQVCFFAEVIAGVFGLGSMMVIWYFARERKLVLGDYQAFKDLDIRDPEAEYDDDDEDEYE